MKRDPHMHPKEGDAPVDEHGVRYHVQRITRAGYVVWRCQYAGGQWDDEEEHCALGEWRQRWADTRGRMAASAVAGAA
jgi:hypothetical protein